MGRSQGAAAAERRGGVAECGVGRAGWRGRAGRERKAIAGGHGSLAMAAAAQRGAHGSLICARSAFGRAGSLESSSSRMRPFSSPSLYIG